MTKFGDALIESLTEAVAFARGETGPPAKATPRTHQVETPDIRAIRRRLHMSQDAFAEAFRIPLATLKNWEQGRRVPDAPAAAYLQAIARRPDVIREALRDAAVESRI
jgi:putative transcriptional regulator